MRMNNLPANLVGNKNLTTSPLTARAKDYITNSKAANTRKAYRSDWACFMSFCESTGLQPLPALPETVALYITYLADQKGYKVSTISRRIASISQAHQIAGYVSPTKEAIVQNTMAGIKRAKGLSTKGAAPITIEGLRRMVATLPENLLGVRDRALLLLGFAGAFRRSELVSLNVSDVEETPEGLLVHLRKSKTDQEGKGQLKAICYGSNPVTCPVRALRAWLEASNITAGPLFRAMDRHGNIRQGKLSGEAVSLIIKRAAKAAGMDPANYSGHSLRAGFCTTAARNGQPSRAIMKQTGHRSEAMVSRYIRLANAFRDNAVVGLGL
jgi:site-specific recombinase XerD